MERDYKSSGTRESFGYAFRGIWYTLKTQGHFQFHLVAAFVVVLCGWWAQLEAWKWLLLVVAIGNVLAAEIFNTAIETVVDLVHADFHPLAGRAKDIAAGGVVITAVQAVIIGIIVFYTPVVNLIKSLF